MKNYYDEPTMVTFNYDDGGEELTRLSGIAYKDFIICSCCGGIFSIEDLKNEAEGEYDLEFEELNWVSFNEYII